MRHFFVDLNRLEQWLLEMAGLVESSIRASVRCFADQDISLADQVIYTEAKINQMEIRIDELATSLVALNQPVAIDMRLIISGLKINTDLERMGDLALSIAHQALDQRRTLPERESSETRPAVVPRAAIQELGASVEKMVVNSINAFVHRDPDLAREVLIADDAVDRMRDAIYEELTAQIEKNGAYARAGLANFVVAKSLERIGDHATNIAENAIFVAEGLDVRHKRVAS